MHRPAINPKITVSIVYDDKDALKEDLLRLPYGVLF